MSSTFRYLFAAVLITALGCAERAHDVGAERSQPPESPPSPTREASPTGSAQTRSAKAVGKRGDAALEARVEERLKNYERMLAEDGVHLDNKERKLERDSIRNSELNRAALRGTKDVPMGAEFERHANDTVGP